MPVTSPDICDAAIVALRATPTVVSAFGEDLSSDAGTKFWADFAPPEVNPPLLVYIEPDSSIEWMTATAANGTAGIESGVLRLAIVAAEKYQARQLADLVASTLDISRVTLTFADGVLMYLRKKHSVAVPLTDILPQTPTGYARLLLMDYMVQRTA